MRDLREFLAKLEKLGEVAHIKAQVDWDGELGAIARRTWDVYGDASPVLLFENVKDYKPPKPNKVLVGIARTYRRIALAMTLPMDLTPKELVREWRRRIKNPVRPRMVETGPCKENKIEGDRVDLFQFPVPHWSERDGQRFLGVMHQVVTRDPETGWVNVGMYRNAIHDAKTLGALVMPGVQHIGIHYAKYIAKGSPMPVSIAIGGPPICTIVSCIAFGVGENEYEMAGALQGEPIELVKSELSDLPVPATAEIVIEGFIDPMEKVMEGPFAEYPGYYGSHPHPKPVMHVKCITYRDDPLFLGTVEGHPVNEDHVMESVGLSAFTWDTLERAGVTCVVDACNPRCSSGFLHAIVAIKPTNRGDATRIASALWATPVSAWGYKHVIVVDEDIDPWDMEQVMWAIATRVKGDESIYVFPRTQAGPIDPRVIPEEKGFQPRMLIDATRPLYWEPREIWGSEGVGKGTLLRYPPVTRPFPETMEKVNNRWNEYGIQPVGEGRGQFAHWWSPEFIEGLKTGRITR